MSAVNTALPRKIAQARARAEFPEPLAPLFQPFRYKIMHGGRGGAKSWGVARALLTIGLGQKTRILCAREVMKTIKESVYQLLVDQITLLGYQSFYTVKENEIIGMNGTQITFTGLRAITAANIKSYEGVDICWVEEGQAVSKKSWTVLIPTIRKEHSEIWVTFNPELDTDDTYKRFVLDRPPKSWVCEINYDDNPWFPDTLEMERVHAKATMSEEEYGHVWEGNPRTTVEGAIYASEILAMTREQRYRPTPYDPNLLVHTIWDLGWNDQTTIVFAQRVQSEVRVINYMEGSFMTYAQWVKALDKLPYAYGSDWLPWDGGITRQDTGMSARKLLRKLGRRAKVTAPHKVEERITSTRIMMPRVYMDNTEERVVEIEQGQFVTIGCARLMECLKRYRRTIPTTTDEPATPRHDEFSHGADAFGGLAMVVDKLRNERQTPLPKVEEWSPAVRGVM